LNQTFTDQLLFLSPSIETASLDGSSLVQISCPHEMIGYDTIRNEVFGG